MEAVLKRKHFYWAEKVYTGLVVKLLPYIAKTPITPNMVTFLNIINSFVLYYLILNNSFVIAAILIQVYLFLDILDGNLARYKNMGSTLGKYLDLFCDILFYNIFYIFLGIKIYIGWEWIVAYLVVQNLYGLIATKYIVPGLKSLKKIKRDYVKQSLMDRGILLGMDMSTQTVITSILLLTSFKSWIIISITILFIIDLLYRLIELKIYNRA